MDAHITDETSPSSLVEQLTEVERQRDQYKALYLQMLELNRKLELGIVGPKRERFVEDDSQLTMGVMQMLVQSPPPPESAPVAEAVAPPARPKPTGRKLLPDALPRWTSR